MTHGFDLDKWVMQREVDEQKDDPHDSIYYTDDKDSSEDVQ